MKNIFLLLMLSVTLFSCKNSEEKNQETDAAVEAAVTYKVYQGEFIYTEEAAVLKGNNFIYGVTLDETAKELAKKVAAVKAEDYDMVPVIVRGEVTKKQKGTEGWDEIITIKEIVNVSDAPAKADVKLEEKKKI